jgi:hypothetical protein
MPGSAAIDFDWGQVEWRFASEANRLAFQNDPQRYAPQYGGFCATAVSNGFTAEIEPDVWHVADGRLFLFNGEGSRADWLAALGSGLVEQGDVNWAKR